MSNNESSAGGNSVTDEQSMRRPLIRFAIKFLTILTCLSCLLLLPGVTQVRHRDAQASGPQMSSSWVLVFPGWLRLSTWVEAEFR
jgi:hypothetical protein